MNNFTIRNATIIFRNLAGKATQYSPEGRRTFSVVIEDEELAQTLINDGWNVKPLKKRDENDPQHYHLPVAVYYGNYPPNIILISNGVKTPIDESTVNMIDWIEIRKVDLTLRPRNYEIGGRSGIKAYLKTMIITVEEDELMNEYADYGEDPGRIATEDDIPF